MVGLTFDRLTVLSRAGSSKVGRAMWRCRCRCGETVIIQGKRLLIGHTRSCGCLMREKASVSFIRNFQRHGESKHSRPSPEYRVWNAMLDRCLNQYGDNYARYGGRGICVCKRWMKFENFLADMGRRPSLTHTIDRIDNDGGYKKSNCRWATRSEQQRNRRNTDRFTFRGQTLPLIVWAERIGIRVKTLRMRIRHGWSIERTLTEPLHGKS